MMIGTDLAKAGLSEMQEKRTRASSLIFLQNLGFNFQFGGGCDKATFPLWPPKVESVLV